MYYIPSRIPTPQFDSTHDTYLAAGYGAGGWQADVSASPTDNYWIAGHFAFIPFTDTAMEILHPGG